MSIELDLKAAEKWWREVGQPTYLETAEILDKEETQRKRDLVERRRDMEEQRHLREIENGHL